MLLFPFFLHSHNTNMTSIYSNIEFPSNKVMISTVASAAGTIMIVRSFARDYVPSELQHYVSTKFHNFLSTFSNEATFLIEEYDGLEKNHLFDAAELHVSTIASPSTTRTYRAKLPEKEKKIHISLGGNEEITEKFRGMVVNWRLMKEKVQPRHIYNPNTYRSNMVSEVRYLRLSFHKKHYQKIVDDYLPYVLESSKSFKERKKTVKLYTLKNDGVHGPGINPWQSVNLDHPSKFETLAMDDEMKKMIIGDLDMFVRRKEFYRKVGKAWKRGYLLFGPPGTGKSSLIAAMANYLNFDVYDLELTDIRSDAELRRLLISTANRSILVVEDIDASIDLSERKKKKRAARPGPPDMYLFHEQRPTVSLSGLLNFVDGLWSSIGDERIIIFTTNHKDKLDPALLRPGRMDMHINMSYCTPCGFKLLANNYLGITEHPLILKAQELIASSKITPAEIGEQLLKREDPELALCGLIDFINDKREEEEKGAKEDVKEEETQDGIGELIKITQEESLKEMDGKMIKRHEAIDALKILAGFLQQEFPTGKTNVVDSQESAKENGSKNE